MWRGSGNNRYPKGEVGILREVAIASPANNPTPRLFLFMDYGEVGYLGCLLIADATFCEQLGKLLMNYYGRSIKDIGDIDLSHLL
jgi:hypothetical protein